MLSRNATQKESVVLSYFSQRRYLPNVSWASGANVAKYSVILPFDFDFCVNSMISTHALVAMDANVASFFDDAYFHNGHLKNIKATNSSYRSYCHQRMEIRFPFPITQVRRFSCAISVEYIPQLEQVLVVYKPRVSKQALPKKWIDMHDFSAWMFKRISNDRTLVSQVHLYNGYGWVANQKVNMMIVPKRGNDIQASMLSYLNLVKQGKFVVKAPGRFCRKMLCRLQVIGTTSSIHKGQGIVINTQVFQVTNFSKKG